MADIELTPAGDRADIAVSPGQRLILRLPETPTTGYRWRLDGAEVVDDRFEPSGSAAGAGGARLLTVVAGTAAKELRLELKRDWDADAERRVSVTIRPDD